MGGAPISELTWTEAGEAGGVGSADDRLEGVTVVELSNAWDVVDALRGGRVRVNNEVLFDSGRDPVRRYEAMPPKRIGPG